MTWDPVWERIYQSRSDWGRYPPEELVRFFARTYYQHADRSAVKVLDLGCGPGAGPSWFVAREGFDLYGIDASATAIERARSRFEAERLKGDFCTGNLAALPYPDQNFDCVIDIGCLQCNTEPELIPLISEIRRVLKPGGKHFSLTSATGTWGEGIGKPIDANTFYDIPEGPFAGMGKNRFSTRDDMARYYADFDEVELNHSIRSVGGTSHEVRNWILTCRKKA